MNVWNKSCCIATAAGYIVVVVVADVFAVSSIACLALRLDTCEQTHRIGSIPVKMIACTRH